VNFVPFHKYGTPKYFYSWSLALRPWLGGACVLLFIAGLIGGLFLAPTDYQQGESFRIIYVHVDVIVHLHRNGFGRRVRADLARQAS
jgi:heme exporter protein C